MRVVRLLLGRAAELAGVSRAEFLLNLGRFQLSVPSRIDRLGTASCQGDQQYSALAVFASHWRVGWLPRLFDEFWTPAAVVTELQEGAVAGLTFPISRFFLGSKSSSRDPSPRMVSIGFGTVVNWPQWVHAMENPSRVPCSDDCSARRPREAAGFRSGEHSRSCWRQKLALRQRSGLGRPSRRRRTMVLGRSSHRVLAPPANHTAHYPIGQETPSAPPTPADRA